MSIDLPLVWAGIIAFGVFMYVLLDGFDLGIGILFPFARSGDDRDLMMNSVAPIWDGNETWLVLGGTGLLAAFPLAYSTILPALYIPVLIFGVAAVDAAVFGFAVRPHLMLLAGLLLAAFVLVPWVTAAALRQALE